MGKRIRPGSLMDIIVGSRGKKNRKKIRKELWQPCIYWGPLESPPPALALMGPGGSLPPPAGHLESSMRSLSTGLARIL